ncbi:MAG TPA: tetratricopeptide repeat protein [Chthoniobacterales bacterium]|nr:tetratricopeptide repeat protein [Chthoniobacterales bacterium]
MKIHFPVACAILLGSFVTSRAQEVRRAVPATPTPALNPFNAPRALPVNPANPQPPLNQQSILNQRIPAQPSADSKRDSASSGSAAEPDNATKSRVANDEIRLAPTGQEQNVSDPAKAQLAIADGLYVRKLYDLAVAEYEKYLGQYPGDSSRASAMYRLADCYSKLGQDVPAISTYRLLISEIGTGEFVGSAAFRLASRAFDQKEFQSAAPLYAKAYENAKSPEVKITARYYQAKCLELTNRKNDAKTAYEEVARTRENNPYRDAARLSVAYFTLENNQKQQAFDLFESLAGDAAKPVVKAEAMTRAGIIAEDLKNRDRAEQLFKSTISLNAEGKWKQIAQLELMKLEYDNDKFSQILDSYAKNLNALGEETKPGVLLIVANSYRQMGKHQKALEVYNQLIRQFSATPEATDARYQRLLSLDQLRDPNLAKEADTYLATAPPRERADKAKLLKAQALVQQNDFALAAKLYMELVNSSLPDSYKADCYYAAGYAFSQVQDRERAIQAFSGLIEHFPTYKNVSKALLKRALLYQEAKNYDAALRDFSTIIQGNGSPDERETALLQKALTLGQQGRYEEMNDSFQQLLKAFPNSSGAAQASYWIGWNAFNQKRYADAVAPLIDARRRNPAEYDEKVTLRLIYCYQTLNKPFDSAREVDNFIKNDPKKVSLVADTCRWLGGVFYDSKQYAGSAKYLGLLTKNLDKTAFDKVVWLTLADAQNQVQAFPDAIASANSYLEQAADPVDRARGFIALSSAQLGAKQFDDATRAAEQALNLQPEGRLNADARMCVGEIEFARGNYENAAKSYLSVAVLYEDPEVTPRALERAYHAFQQAGNQDQATKTLSELKARFPNYLAKTPAAG